MRRALALAALACACAPDLGAPDWLVDRPRLLAVRAEPPEVAPGGSARFTLLAADPAGELDASAAAWAACAAPLPLTESGAVATACLGPLPALAEGASALVATSADACSRFGPIASPEVQRAREPDATGGYYQPVRVLLGGETGFALQRLRCPLAQASLAVAQEYAARYRPNQNPQAQAIAASAPLDAVAPGARVQLSLPVDAPESFPLLDPAAQALVDRQETISISWYATGGSLAASRGAANAWTAPSAPGPVHLWAVARDSRGGVTWAAARATVTAR